MNDEIRPDSETNESMGQPLAEPEAQDSVIPFDDLGNSNQLTADSSLAVPPAQPSQEPEPADLSSPPKVSFDLTSDQGFATIKIPVGETRLQSLPNQKVGEEFSEIIDELSGFKQIDVSGLPDGISFDADNRELKGNPTTPGQYKVHFICRQGLGSATVLEFSLVIVPDPKTLWKNIPTDKTAPFWKTDYSAEVDSTSNMYAVAASNRGRSHAHDGKFREDDYSLLCVGPGAWSVFCVADGAGSASLSRRGSEVASKIATKRLASLLETQLSPILEKYSKPVEKIEEDQEVNTALYESLIRAAYDAAVAVKTEAGEHGVEPRDMSTTLLLVAVKKFAIGHVVVGFNIGDGASGVLYNDNKDLYLLCIPEGGDFAGQTKFLHTDEFREENNQGSRLRITVLPSFDAIAVMSDGVSDAKFASDNALTHAEDWKKLIYEDWMPSVLPGVDPKSEQFPEASADLKQRANDWLDYWAVGTHDDRTLIVAFPKETK